jgi:alpha-ketoglutarate-dependent taurine dioxygenase
VIQVHPACKDDFDFLKERFNDPQYAMEFRPREGDIVAFDNWRVMHARDEVFGLHVRRHWRAWISGLKPSLLPRYYLGVRPVTTKIAAEIEAANSGS